MKWLLGVALVGFASNPAPNAEEQARAFLASLEPAKRAKAAVPYDDDRRVRFNYVTGHDTGVPLSELNTEQRQRALALLDSCLSEAGAGKVRSIRSLESELHEMEGGNPGRDPNLYRTSVFGQPSGRGVWAWRFEGHHVSLTFGFKDGKLVSSTPQFLGANPDPSPLKEERDLALELVKTLTASQRKRAILDRRVPADIITSMDRKAETEGRDGIAFRDLDLGQQKLLDRLIKTHAAVQNPAEQKRRWDAVQKNPAGDIVFAWIGPADPKARHYYRIQGTHFLIEYDCTAGDGSHIHTVWRNLKEDFGVDPLAEHYRHGHAH